MLRKLQKILLSVPTLSVAGFVVFYLLFGFLALPAIVKWQAEKQVQAHLGHSLQLGAVRFNPVLLRAEIDDLKLADTKGQDMLGFKHLVVDFEVRSVIDRAWTFANLSLDTPFFRIEVDKSGNHNFTDLINKFGSSQAQKESRPLPRIALTQFELTNGQVEFSDLGLVDPLVTRVDPINVKIDRLSTLPEGLAEYQISAKASAGESFELAGQIRLNPIASKGQITLKDLSIETLVRGLSRQIALDKPKGKVALNANFDLTVNEQTGLSGLIQSIEFAIDSLSLNAQGQESPLFAMKSASLEMGRVNLGSREVSFSALSLVDGGASLMMDAQGRSDWSKVVNQSPGPTETVPANASGTPPGKPWHVAIEKILVSDIAFQFSDPAAASRASAAAFGANFSLVADFSPAGLQIALNKANATIVNAQLDQGNDSLSVPNLGFGAGQIDFGSTESGIKLTTTASHVAAEKGIAARLGDASFDLQLPRVDAQKLEVDTGGGRITGRLEKPRLTAASLSMKSPAMTTQLDNFALAGEQVTLKQDSGQFELGLNKLYATLSQFKLAQDVTTVRLEKINFNSEKLSTSQGNSGLKIRSDKPDFSFAALATKRASDSIDIASVKLDGDSIAMEKTNDKTRFLGAGALIKVSGLVARNENERVSLKETAVQLKALQAGVSAKVGDSQLQIEDGKFTLTSLGIAMQGAASEVARLGGATIGVTSMKAALADGPVQLTGNGISVALSDALLHSPADKNELVRVSELALTGGAIRLHERMAGADKLTVSKGMAHMWVDPKGELNLLSLFASKTEAPKAIATPAPASPWRVTLASAQLDDFAVAFEDRRESPPLAIALEAIHAKVSGLDSGSTTPMQLVLRTKLASGGLAQANGTVRADNGATDLKVELSDIVLAPVQTYISQIANLRLASGTASATGQLQYGAVGEGAANLTYTGSVSVDQFLLEELEAKRPFLSWNSIASDDIKFASAPNNLDIGELRVERPSGRLIIAKDQSVNWTDVLKKKPGDEGPGKEKDAGTSEKSEDSNEPQFPVTIARVRISDGLLDFADLSLRPQFGAQMHELKGIVTGLGTDANASAKIQLDARVDKFGSAKIRGQTSILRPESLTDIGLEFRNIEMTSLSPYVAKFAGYSIASGRLALDLQYKVRDGKLLGQNKVVLKQVELGEKVESPDALDLPLELALAVLKDGDGVIDIGLPVTGDLNDPKFDYGAVIGKAIGNLLGGIVTAPFRALAALFGAGDQQKLDAIEFEPGHTAIAPPEKEKLQIVARALKQRPNLMLVVPPTYAITQDTAVLKSILVRSEIVQGMGIALTPGEDPGPIDGANPRVADAVEAAFVQRYAPEVLATLKRRAIEANQPAEKVGANTTDAPIAKLPYTFYQGLIDRLIEEEPVSEIMLAQLATLRAEAIVADLVAMDGTPAQRISIGEAVKASESSEDVVTLRLQLKVAK